MNTLSKTIAATISIISIVALCLGIIAVCITHPRTEIEFDYLGLLIGIVTLLVAFTVGWQIYTIIDTKGTIASQNNTINGLIDKIREQENNIEKRVKKIEHDSMFNMGLAHLMVHNFQAAIMPFCHALICMSDDVESEDYKNTLFHLRFSVEKTRKGYGKDADLLPNINLDKEFIKNLRQALILSDDDMLIQWSVTLKAGEEENEEDAKKDEPQKEGGENKEE